jgi:hypothetical protein
MLSARSVRCLSNTTKSAINTSVVVYKAENQGEIEKFYPIKREVKKFGTHDNKVEYLTTKLDDVANYIRAGSLWPMTFG